MLATVFLTGVVPRADLLRARRWSGSGLSVYLLRYLPPPEALSHADQFHRRQLRDPDTAVSNQVLRTCVHCGFCTATCPTFLLLGDELDSPRGRIYLIKDMLETGRPATEEVVRHVDRCLSCLSCMTTCPSGVNYMHLVDHARSYIEQTYRRPWPERLLRARAGLRAAAAGAVPLALRGARLARPLARLIPGQVDAGATPARDADLAPAHVPPPSAMDGRTSIRAEGERKARVALLAGCAQQVLAPQINEATIRLLTRLGVEVVVAEGAGCCGALTHHMGQHDRAMAQRTGQYRGLEPRDRRRRARRDRHQRLRLRHDGEGLRLHVPHRAGTMAQPAPRRSPRWPAISASSSSRFGYAPTREAPGLTVAYHSACSLQHGQQVTAEPKTLLQRAGFRVVEPAEPHICCGSAGTYNLLQPEIAGRLRDRKLGNLQRDDAGPDRRRQYRLHHAACRRQAFRSCTPSNCWTGWPAVRRRRACE